MYDRKTWVVLAICGALLATNVYFSGQQAKLEAEKKKQEELQKKLAPKPEVTAEVKTPESSTPTPAPSAKEETVTLESNEVIFTLTNIGGGIKHAEFKKQFQVGSKTARVQINRFGKGPIAGLAGAGEALENAPYAYSVEESIPNKKAVYVAQLPSGLKAKKVFSLVADGKPGADHLLDFELKLENASTVALNLSQWSIFLGEASPLYQAEVGHQTGFYWQTNGEMHFKDSSKFKGGMFWGQPTDLLKGTSEKPIDAAGVTNQFFTTVIHPAEPAVSSVWSKHSDVKLSTDTKPLSSVNAGLQLPAATLNPNEFKTLKYLIFIGPKHNTLLRKMDNARGDGWADVMQYGWFWFVSRPLNFLLNLYHNLIAGLSPNWSWGLAIILLTVTVRTLIWPLHAKSTHTMKRMAKLQPEMAKIKEKYPDDPQKVQMETMGLYKKFGINPLGGCLPMLIQIPIFFGFYRMLEYAVELRGQGFLWVNDLSQPDTLMHIAGIPINILPVVMAISSFLQIRMTPKTGDAMQQKIIMLMPFMFFFFCYNFASALALYWTTQNIFSIGQTWLMSKVPEPELVARPVSTKKSWMQRMAEQQAEMQKRQKQGGNMRDVTPEAKKKPRTPKTGG
ncbi:MAG: membrane protein insertase YidC [Akkermansiaceae bacterium]|nr:membrane protein insertase YidC [Akkermansiaceae bacterium]